MEMDGVFFFLSFLQFLVVQNFHSFVLEDQEWALSYKALETPVCWSGVLLL